MCPVLTAWSVLRRPTHMSSEIKVIDHFTVCSTVVIDHFLSTVCARAVSGGLLQPKRPTIYEVADRAGAPTRRSRVICRHNGGMKPATRGAGPGRHRRAQLPARTGWPAPCGPGGPAGIAILLPDGHPVPPPSAADRASATAHEAGYTVDLVGSEGEPRTERRGPRSSPTPVSSRASWRWLPGGRSRAPARRPRSSSSPTTTTSMHGLGALADGAGVR